MIRTIFFILAIASAWWGIVSSIVIVSFLKKRGIKINYLLLRILILKYIHQYHQITRQETDIGQHDLATFDLSAMRLGMRVFQSWLVAGTERRDGRVSKIERDDSGSWFQLDDTDDAVTCSRHKRHPQAEGDGCGSGSLSTKGIGRPPEGIKRFAQPSGGFPGPSSDRLLWSR